MTITNIATDDSGNYSVVVSNPNFSVGSSNVVLLVVMPPQNLFAQWTNGNRLSLRLNGTPNYPYILQIATNLTLPVNWQPVLTNPADNNGSWQFIETNLGSRQKFYRAVGQ